MFQSTFLEPPFGKCGARKLLKYHDDHYGNYRYSKCQREGATDAFEKACGCKDAYMPGSTGVCKMNEYLRCGGQDAGDTPLLFSYR